MKDINLSWTKNYILTQLIVYNTIYSVQSSFYRIKFPVLLLWEDYPCYWSWNRSRLRQSKFRFPYFRARAKKLIPQQLHRWCNPILLARVIQIEDKRERERREFLYREDIIARTLCHYQYRVCKVYRLSLRASSSLS